MGSTFLCKVEPPLLPGLRPAAAGRGLQGSTLGTAVYCVPVSLAKSIGLVLESIGCLLFLAPAPPGAGPNRAPVPRKSPDRSVPRFDTNIEGG